MLPRYIHTCLAHASPAPAAHASASSTIIELLIATALATVGVIAAMAEFKQHAENTRAEATGVYQTIVKRATDAYLSTYYAELSGGLPVAGVANPLAPTFAELRALPTPLLVGTFPDRDPMGSQTNITLTLLGACPGVGCNIQAIGTAQTRILDAAGNPRYGLMAQVRNATEGGIAADFFRQAQLVGTTATVANPFGAAGGGAYGFYTSLDTTTFNLYVRRGDTRPTTLNNTLTVNGAFTANGAANVDGDLNVKSGANTCVTVSQTGVVTINCNGRLNAATGVFTSAAGDVVTIDPATGVVTNKSVVGQSGLATNSATLFASSDPNAIVVNSGSMFIKGSSGTLVSFTNGDMTLPGSANVGGTMSANRVAVREAVTEGSACTSGSGATEYAATVDGSLAACRGGVWRSITKTGTKDAACAPSGAFASDLSTGTGLICRGGVWTVAVELISNMKLVDVLHVFHGDTVPMPACYATGANVPTPLIMLYGASETSADGTYNRFATADYSGRGLHGDSYSGGQWRVASEETRPPVGVENRNSLLAATYCVGSYVIIGQVAAGRYSERERSCARY